MEMALRRRLEGVAEIRISQERQSAEVRFSAGAHEFRAPEFRAAVAEADVEVLAFAIEACGRIERQGHTAWFVAEPNRFVVDGGTQLTGAACVSAHLDDGAPERLVGVRSIGPAPR